MINDMDYINKMESKISKIEIVLMNNNATVPKKGTQYSAGYDLYASEDGVIEPNKRTMISTGIKMSIPNGYFGKIFPRSGLAVKNGINVLAGVIDSDYVGEIKVVLANHNDKAFEYKIGDRIAQLIILKCEDVDFELVDNLTATNRGEGGFGSTGKS